MRLASLWRRRSIRLLVPLLILLLGAGLAWFVVSASATSSQNRAGAAAMSYARTTMVWSSGPGVHSVQVVPLRNLAATLRASAPSALQQDVNVADLIRRVGPDRRVALVLLSGTYNTLPPDEGVIVNGEVAAIVDLKTNRVLLLTD